MLLNALSKTTAENPFVCHYLPAEERWHILNGTLNHLSCVFAPHHLFSDQVSSYESSWFVFSLVGKPFSNSNLMMIVVINEQEIREICSGEFPEPNNLHSERHKSRWTTMQKFSKIFEAQLSRECQGARSAGVPDGMRAGKFAFLDGLDEVDKDGVDANGDFDGFLRIHVPIPLLKETKTHGPQDVVLYE